LLLLAWACDRSGQPDEIHEHGEPGEEPVQVTLFSERFEYFIEHDALEVGESSGFLVHITRLDTYKPVSSGSLTLRIGGESITEASPVRPGIFQTDLVPASAGTHEITYQLELADSTDRVKEPVKVRSDHHHETAEKAHLPAEEGEISFLKEQAWQSDFMVSEIRPSGLTGVIRASGEVLAVPGKKKHLPAQASGVLVFRQTNLVEGSKVEKGQPLFVISAASLGADNFELMYRELKNSLEKSRSEYLRHRALYSEEIVSEQKLIASRTLYVNDSLRFQNLSARASEEGVQVISPISGYIHELGFSEGQYVEPGDQLVTISSNEKLLLRADVPMQHYSVVGRIFTANFRTAYSDKIYDLESLGGTLLSRGSSVAENDHFIPVYFEVNNDGTLLEGAFVEFYLKTGRLEEALVVPVSALTEEQGMRYCYRQVTGETYTRTAVKTGDSDGKVVQVTEGIGSGDRIVTRGTMLLKAASMMTGETGHGHAH